MAPKNNTIEYNKSLNWLLVAPVVAVILPSGLGGGYIEYVVQAIVFGCIGYLYFRQARFLRSYSLNKRVRLQIGFLLAAFFMPAIGACLGSVIGAAHFGTDQHDLGIAADVLMVLTIAETSAFIPLFIITAVNARFIATNGGGNILRSLSKAAYIVGYIVVAAITWLAYQIIYMLHDPNTE